MDTGSTLPSSSIATSTRLRLMTLEFMFRSLSPSTMSLLYTVDPLTSTFGGVVTGGFSIDDAADADDELIEKIRADIHKYRFLLFRKQKDLTGERQVVTFRGNQRWRATPALRVGSARSSSLIVNQVWLVQTGDASIRPLILSVVAFSQRLGSIESTFYKHPKSPHKDIFRVSNEESVGCTQVGRSGWHVDGTFLQMPFRYQTMYFPKASSTGFTELVPLKELFEQQNAERQDRWNRCCQRHIAFAWAWFVSDNGRIVHPLVYKHPTTGYTTMIFHCGRPFCACWVMDYSPDTRPSEDQILPPSELQNEITQSIQESRSRNLVYTMKWEEGDFGILDNLALAHYAVPGTQDPASEVGLRILHRTTIEGESIPRKSRKS